jgi:hypothetical protein
MMMQKQFGNEISGPGILNYHSSREERISRSLVPNTARCEGEKPRPRGILARLFGSARGSKLSLVNMIVLVFIFVFYQVVTANNPAGTWKRDGFRFSLSAFRHEEKILASLRITKEKTAVHRGAAPEVRLEGGGVSEVFTPGLPLTRGETTYVRTTLPCPEPPEVSCTIVFDGTTKRLAVREKQE